MRERFENRAHEIVGIEIQGVRTAIDKKEYDSGIYYEEDNNNPDMYSVYLRLNTGLAEAVGDFPTIELAEFMAFSITTVLDVPIINKVEENRALKPGVCPSCGRDGSVRTFVDGHKLWECHKCYFRCPLETAPCIMRAVELAKVTTDFADNWGDDELMFDGPGEKTGAINNATAKVLNEFRKKQREEDKKEQ